MKILVLMPCDERMTYYAAKIYSELTNETKDITFSMPMFMDYLISSKIVGNWIYAFYDSFVSMKKVYEASGKGNLIVFGTAPKSMHFDVVFSFQDDKEQLTYEDKFLAHIKNAVSEEPILAAYTENLYDESDVTFKLHNCKATAQFLSDYIKTDYDLEKIQEKYKDKLKFKKGDVDVRSSVRKKS